MEAFQEFRNSDTDIEKNFVSLQSFFMIKPQHNTLKTDEDEIKQNRTPLRNPLCIYSEWNF